MKTIIRVLFRATIAAIKSFLVCGLAYIVLGGPFSYFMFACATVVLFFITPKSYRVWRLMISNYRSDDNPSRMAWEGGFLKDKWEDDEGILILTSISKEGLILCRPHLISYLRQTALIPWSDLEVESIRENPREDDQVVDQNERMLAEIKVNGIHPKLEIPWSKELELYTNINLNHLNLQS